MVGNRYDLNHREREVLHRGVFSSTDSLRRRGKRVLGTGWLTHRLMVDGHNVQITVESALLNRFTVLATDGALRDIAGLSARYRMNRVTFAVINLVIDYLHRFQPREIVFLFDAPMSQSGRLASLYRQQMRRLGMPGEARAVAVPESQFDYHGAVLAGSDRVVLDGARRWLDLARRVIDHHGVCCQRVDFSPLVSA